MTSQQDFFRTVVSRLEAAGIPCMVAGSVASSFYGHPRATQDVDVVIDPSEAQLRDFLQQTTSTWYVDAGTALDALRRRTQFNLIDQNSGWKIDFMIRKNRPFSVEEFARRRRQTVLGTLAPVVSLEDCILSKLEWAAKGGSERQISDVRAMLKAGRDVDTQYLQHWAAELGISESLNRVLTQQ